jgi:dTMP kinase
MPLHQIDDLHSLILDGYYPNKTFILDLPVEDAMKRLSGRNEVNRFDRMPIDMHNKIRSAYLDLSKRGENRYTVIDASLNSIAVFEQIQPYIDEML